MVVVAAAVLVAVGLLETLRGNPTVAITHKGTALNARAHHVVATPRHKGIALTARANSGVAINHQGTAAPAYPHAQPSHTVNTIPQQTEAPTSWPPDGRALLPRAVWQHPKQPAACGVATPKTAPTHAPHTRTPRALSKHLLVGFPAAALVAHAHRGVPAGGAAEAHHVTILRGREGGREGGRENERE